MNGISDIKAALDYHQDRLEYEYKLREDGKDYSDSTIYELEDKVEHLKIMLEKAMETLFII